jgi:hypothetical protein
VLGIGMGGSGCRHSRRRRTVEPLKKWKRMDAQEPTQAAQAGTMMDSRIVEGRREEG